MTLYKSNTVVEQPLINFITSSSNLQVAHMYAANGKLCNISTQKHPLTNITSKKRNDVTLVMII